MENKSIWSDIDKKVKYPKINKDISYDVLIIGGGITGISCAYHLINSGLKVGLVEANYIGSGITSRTTGKLTYLQEDLLSKIKTYRGKEDAKLYLESQREAINLVCNIIKKENILCNLEKVKSYIFDSDKKKLDSEIAVLKELGVKVFGKNKLPNGKKTNCFYVNDTYVFQPLKYVYSLGDICTKNGIDIYEDSRIFKIDRYNDLYICRTKKNMIQAKYVILALHYPYFLKPFFLPLKSYIEKSYIEAIDVDKNYKFSAINISGNTNSIRYHSDNDRNFQIVCSNSHNLSIKENDKKNFDELLQLGGISPSYLWSNEDIMTMDSIPYIGSISHDKTLLMGTGYNTWGMTNGNIAGKILSDIILEKNNKYLELFNPLRGINMGKIINFPVVLGSNIYSYAKSKLKKNKSWYSSRVKFEIRDGVSVGIYVDEENREHIIYNKCPHLGCGLTFNEIEKTWDCPCHGSRFDIDGRPIIGPSNYNITYKR